MHSYEEKHRNLWCLQEAKLNFQYIHLECFEMCMYLEWIDVKVKSPPSLLFALDWCVSMASGDHWSEQCIHIIALIHVYCNVYLIENSLSHMLLYDIFVCEKFSCIYLIAGNQNELVAWCVDAWYNDVCEVHASLECVC